MTKLKLTAIVEYDANPSHYPGAKSAEEAKLDLEDYYEIIEHAANEDLLDVKIEPV